METNTIELPKLSVVDIIQRMHYTDDSSVIDERTLEFAKIARNVLGIVGMDDIRMQSIFDPGRTEYCYHPTSVVACMLLLRDYFMRLPLGNLYIIEEDGIALTSLINDVIHEIKPNTIGPTSLDIFIRQLREDHDLKKGTIVNEDQIPAILRTHRPVSDSEMIVTYVNKTITTDGVIARTRYCWKLTSIIEEITKWLEDHLGLMKGIVGQVDVSAVIGLQGLFNRAINLLEEVEKGNLSEARDAAEKFIRDNLNTVQRENN